MKILAFVDLHGNDKALNEIKNKSKKADIIVCAGDISIFENNLDILLTEINKINKTVLIVPGNHEESRDIDEISRNLRNIKNIHKKSFVEDDYLFLGYGGSGFCLNDTVFEGLKKKFEDTIKESGKKKVVLITHAPPYQTNIDKIMDDSCGNRSIKKFIIKTNPDLVISGHLHENAGKKDLIGRTKIINPGPFGMMIDL